MAESSSSTENTSEEEKVETVEFGLWWPAGDPGELRAAAAAWEAMANHLDTTTTILAGAAGAVTQANSATAISAFAGHWQRTGGPGGALPTIAGYCRNMATALREFADEIDDARKKILQLAAEIVASVAIGVGLAFFTAGISAAAVTVTTARIIGLAAQIGVNVGLRAATIISRVAVVGAMGSVESMATNTIVQLGRNVAFNDNHNPLDGFNLGEVAASGVPGFVGGGALAGRAFQRLRDRLRPKDLPPVRPGWRNSEIDVGADLAARGYKPQRSFLNGKEVPYGTKGSVRPDHHKPGSSVEVKNYDVTTSQGRSSLVNNVSGQAGSRAANLPPGTKQSVVIDVRGQAVSDATLDDIAGRIVTRSGGVISRSDITFKR